jgi:hypothetical protein
MWNDLRDIITDHTGLRGVGLLCDLLDKMNEDPDEAMKLITVNAWDVGA